MRYMNDYKPVSSLVKQLLKALEWGPTEDAYEFADYTQSLIHIAYPEMMEEQAVQRSIKEIQQALPGQSTDLKWELAQSATDNHPRCSRGYTALQRPTSSRSQGQRSRHRQSHLSEGADLGAGRTSEAARLLSDHTTATATRGTPRRMDPPPRPDEKTPDPSDPRERWSASSVESQATLSGNAPLRRREARRFGGDGLHFHRTRPNH